MGEAKRRQELGLLPRQKKIELNKSDRYLILNLAIVFFM